MYIALVLDEQSKKELLQAFPPRFPDVIGHHITLTFGVSKNVNLPPQPTDVKVVGCAINDDGIEALVVSVNDKTKRADGSTYHITWSIDRSKGFKPADSNTLLVGGGYQSIDTPVEINTEIKLLK